LFLVRPSRMILRCRRVMPDLWIAVPRVVFAKRQTGLCLAQTGNGIAEHRRAVFPPEPAYAMPAPWNIVRTNLNAGPCGMPPTQRTTFHGSQFNNSYP